MYEFVKNFYDMFGRDDLFCPASEGQTEQLSRLFGTNVEKVTEFYREHQPDNMPMLDSYVSLLGIDRILLENTSGEPGKYLAKFGVFVFAVTVGGNVLCIEANDCKDGDASVLIADANFCSYNDHYGCAEIGIIPKRAAGEFLGKGMVALNYPNIKKCLTKIEPSFLLFMEKLSRNEYEDVEEYLE